MHPISPLPSIIPLNPVHPSAIPSKEDPALQPSRQSLITIPALTPSLEEVRLAEQTLKLKLSAIESKTQENIPKAPSFFPQILLDLELSKDLFEVFPFIESLSAATVSYFRLPSSLLSLINIHFIIKCEALGLKLFLDLDLSLSDLKRLPALAYTQAALLSYNLHGASIASIEEAIQAHHYYFPASQMVFKSSQFPTLESTITFLDSILPSYQRILPLNVASPCPKTVVVYPHLVCKPEELAPLRKKFGPSLPLIVEGESTWSEGPLELAKIPSLSLASFILLGRSIFGAKSPQLELEHIIRYLKSSF